MTLPGLNRAYWTAFIFQQAIAEKSFPYLPIERIIEIQRRRLRDIIRHAFERVPFYRDVMRSRGLNPRDFRSAEDLSKLPLIDSRDYLRQLDTFRPSIGTAEPILKVYSSGTTGCTKTFDYDARALFLALAHGQRQRHALAHFTGRSFGYRELNLARESGVSSQLREFYERYSWTPRCIDLRRKMVVPGELPLEREIEEISRFRPDVLMGYGSYLGALLRKAHSRGLRLPNPQAVVYGGDTMPDFDRNFIEKDLGIPVLSFYQAAEALRIGFQCELRRGLHLSLDAVAVRVVNEEGHEVRPGERGHLVISNLTNFATVLLNYRLGDVVTLSRESCPCGRSLPMIEAIEGRTEDLIHLTDGRLVHALQLVRKLRVASGLDRMQVVQWSGRQFMIRVVAPKGIDRRGVEASLAAAMEMVAGYPCRTEVEWLDCLVPEANGKTRLVVSHWRPANDVEGG